MVKINRMKKIFAAFSILAFVIMAMPIANIVEAGPVDLGISAPSSYNVKEGDSVSFVLTLYGDIADVEVRNSSIELVGFTANKVITGSGNSRTVTLTNVQGVGTGKYIRVAGGIGMSSTGDLSNPVNSSLFTISARDTVAPVMTISGPNPSKVYAGGTVSYVLTFTDDVGVVDLEVLKSAIALEGFTADVSISGSGLSTRTVTLSNIQGAVGGNKYIRVAGGLAMDAEGNLSNPGNSIAFIIEEKTTPVDPTPVDPTPVDPTPVDPEPEKPNTEKPADWIPNPNTGK